MLNTLSFLNIAWQAVGTIYLQKAQKKKKKKYTTSCKDCKWQRKCNLVKSSPKIWDPKFAMHYYTIWGVNALIHLKAQQKDVTQNKVGLFRGCTEIKSLNLYVYLQVSVISKSSLVI